MLLKITIIAALAAVVNSASQSFTAGIERIDLNADRSMNIWTASGINSTGTEIRVPATVPGGIYSDLEDSGVFSNPIFHEYNDVENRWPGRMNWNFSRNFEVTTDLLLKTDVTLVCEGLDTIGDVYVNDVLVGKSENMFVRYIFDVKDILRVGVNTIRVAFASPVQYAYDKYDEHVELYGYPVVPGNQPEDYRAELKVQMMRKMPASFAWDWGPSYPNSGIWKDIYIEGYSGAVIRDVMIFNTPSRPIPDETVATNWNVTARIYYDAASTEATTLSFGRVGSPGVSTNVNLIRGRGNFVDVSVSESGADTKLWWPNGYGDQNLYWYNVVLPTQNGQENSTRALRFGFRTVELIEDLIDEQNAGRGREFYFRVNGIPMYSKGSNSIPLHVLPERVTKEHTEWVMRSAKLGHQNMIRVWGGGIYESEWYYDYADEYGIFIWEDFMFACSMYPATEEFLANVLHEVDTQVKRLQYRTSLALWAGNNENEMFLRFDFLGTESRFQTYYEDYVKLFVDTIKPLTEEMDPSRSYIASSPTNGIRTEEEGWVAENPQDVLWGDVHFYNYATDNWDPTVFWPARYASEYGFQSFPSYETLAGRADNISSWSWNSPETQHRQHHPWGQKEIVDYIRDHLPLPEDINSTEAFPYMLYMSQITQAMGQKTETEYYRRLVDKLGDNGAGHNMGALYWQLNDIWEGCSWASVEITGRWKMQMYYSQKFLAPIVPSPYRDANGDLVVELISDLPRTIRQGPLYVKVFKLGSMSPVYEEFAQPAAEFLKSKEVHRIRNSTLAELGCADKADSGAADPCVVHVTFSDFSNFHFLQYPKNKLGLKDPQLKIEDVQASPDGHTITFSLTTEAVAPFVFLNVKGDPRGYFSDNGFLQTETLELSYYSENGITAQEFIERTEIMSLFDVTKVAGELVPVSKEENC